eukprot:TRINITY_DN2996_c1_g1_i1.p2 TRINITY_DN2996_c1_g1~~TRINITY_DN2996_c1_g1_i1.p2  ORF type:complete len:128 (+),score=14.95 TRINITY_DN2996_c1_g1_i1:101-484(+)
MRESKKKDEKKQPPPHIHSVWTLVVRLCVESEGFLGGKRKRRRKKKEKKKNVSEGVSIRAVKTKKNDEKKKEEGGRLLVGFNRKKRKKIAQTLRTAAAWRDSAPLHSHSPHPAQPPGRLLSRRVEKE